MLKIFLYIAALLAIPRESDAYSVDICMDACKNLQDKASASLCELCATDMCTSACGYIGETYNSWLDSICTQCFYIKPVTMIFVCQFSCKNTQNKENEVICERCYHRQ